MDLNSSRFSNLISASNVFSASNSAFNPEASNTFSTNSVRVKSSLISFSFSMIFLNSNSFPEEIASYKLIPSLSDTS